MKPRLMIHAGIHRTGTTAVQKTFAHHRAALAARGVLYPFDGDNHQSIAWALHRKQTTGADLAERIASVVTATTAWVVLSGEDFAIHMDLGWLETLADRFDCAVTIYLRRQDDWVMSWYNQHIKWPFDARKSRMSPEEFLLTLDDYHWLDFEGLLGRWVAVLGQDNVHVGILERGGMSDTAADLLGRVGIEPLVAPEAGVNESIPAAAAEILRFLSVYDMPYGQRMVLQRAVRQGLIPTLPKGRAIYAPDIRNRIIDRYAAGNAAVARRYLGHGDGQLFRQARCPADDPYERPRLPGAEELLEKHIGPLVRQLAQLAANAAGKR
jgi:hypothetical protein